MAKKSEHDATDITVRQEGDTVVVTVPVKFYRRNGRQHVIAKDSNQSQTKSSANKTNPNQTLITNIAKALLSRLYYGRKNSNLASTLLWTI